MTDNTKLRAESELPRIRDVSNPFQARVWHWLDECFGQQIATDKHERNFRLLEETLELVQTCGCKREEAHQLVDYVYDRPWGNKHQEIGGVMVTLASLCLAHNENMDQAGRDELLRVWDKIEVIRAKHAGKPVRSPLPI